MDCVLGKHVQMSSILEPDYLDDDTKVEYGGDKLVDGKYHIQWGQPEFSMASTKTENQPWLIIYLEKVFLVYALNISNAAYSNHGKLTIEHNFHTQHQ